MNRKLFKSVISLFIFLFLLSSCSPEKISLWNGKDLSGWKLFVEDPDIDVNDIWSVKDGVIHCTGVPNGYMRTESDYSNYILYLEWRWVEKGSNRFDFDLTSEGEIISTLDQELADED